MVPTGWPWVLAAFLLFRLLDIWKPWPIRWVDRRVGGGFGIMLDDVLAGLGAGVLLLAADFLISHL
ncbi:MAG TPA: phosphatidylglycerophosphatase A, partial [Gammaproteobacteria bacterium]